MDETAQGNTSYNKRPLWQWILLYVVIAVVAYGLIYYFFLRGKNSSYQGSTQQRPTEIYVSPTTIVTITTRPTTSPSSTTTTQSFTVSGSEFAFSPAVLTVKKGETVKITFKNMGKYAHNLTITDLGVATKTIQPSQEDTITFTPTKAGTFTYLCTVDSHAAQGMKGSITVQ